LPKLQKQVRAGAEMRRNGALTTPQLSEDT
jgi:hypothetical protein